MEFMNRRRLSNDRVSNYTAIGVDICIGCPMSCFWLGGRFPTPPPSDASSIGVIRSAMFYCSCQHVNAMICNCRADFKSVGETSVIGG